MGTIFDKLDPRKKAREIERKVVGIFTRRVPALAKSGASKVEHGAVDIFGKRVPALAETGADKIEHAAMDVFRDRIPALAQEAAGEVEDAVTEKLPEIAANAVRHLAEAGAEHVFETGAKAVRAWHRGMVDVRDSHPALVEQLDVPGFRLDLRTVTTLGLTYQRFYSRAEGLAEVLDRLAHDGVQLRRRSIRTMMRTLGPDAVDPGVGAGVALGAEVGAHVGLTEVPLELFVVLADEGLAAMGVPE